LEHNLILQYWWIGIGFTVATIIVEYILMIAFGVIVGAAIFSQVINGPGTVKRLL
jgi:hypothetical protein